MISKLLELLTYEGPEISSEFKKASIVGRGTSQEVADYREQHFHTFIGRYFPFPYRIAKGNVIDTFGLESPSIDCLIINPNHPHTINAHGKFSVIFVDGVDVAIEIKPELAQKEELDRGLKQVQNLKKLRRSKTPLLFTDVAKAGPDVIDLSIRVPSFIFANTAKADPMDTGREVLEYYRNNGVPLQEQVDYIVVNNVGILSNYKFPQMSRAKGNEPGLFLEHWGDLTIAAFLLYVNYSFHASALVSEAVLPRYLKGMRPSGVSRVTL